MVGARRRARAVDAGFVHLDERVNLEVIANRRHPDEAVFHGDREIADVCAMSERPSP
jgi:hypothetical protein